MRRGAALWEAIVAGDSGGTLQERLNYQGDGFRLDKVQLKGAKIVREGCSDDM